MQAFVRYMQTTNIPRIHLMDEFPRWLSGKEPACQCRRCCFNPWIGKIPWRRKWQPTSSILAWRIPWTEEPGELYSPGSHKELDTSEQLNNYSNTPGGWYESVSSLVVSDSVTPWTIACQAPLFMEISRQEYWNGLPFPSPGDLPDSEIKPRSPALQADSLPAEPATREALMNSVTSIYIYWIMKQIDY